MINEGWRRLYVREIPSHQVLTDEISTVVVFILVHVMIFVFGFANYGFKVR